MIVIYLVAGKDNQCWRHNESCCSLAREQYLTFNNLLNHESNYSAPLGMSSYLTVVRQQVLH